MYSDGSDVIITHTERSKLKVSHRPQILCPVPHQSGVYTNEFSKKEGRKCPTQSLLPKRKKE